MWHFCGSVEFQRSIHEIGIRHNVVAAKHVSDIGLSTRQLQAGAGHLFRVLMHLTVIAELVREQLDQ